MKKFFFTSNDLLLFEYLVKLFLVLFFVYVSENLIKSFHMEILEVKEETAEVPVNINESNESKVMEFTEIRLN